MAAQLAAEVGIARVPSVDWDSRDGSPSPVEEIDLQRQTLRPALFDYQLELVNAMGEAMSERRAALISLPTGAGKTRTAVAALLEGWASNTVGRVVWLAPTIEVLDQATETMAALWAQHGTAPDIRILPRPTSDPGSLVWFATPQAVYARRKTLSRYGPWDAVVFDEAHQLGARTFQSAVRELRNQGSSRAALIGLSATPGRVRDDETADLLRLFERKLLVSPLLGTDPVKTLQRRGVLARLDFRSFTSGIVPEDEAGRLKIAARACREVCRRGGRPLVFCESVPGALVLAEMLRESSHSAGVVHSQLRRQERAGIIGAFAAGNIQVLINHRLLATGYDCPSVSDVLILGTIGSPILFEQIVGRGARGPKTGGFRTARIWQFTDHLELHGLPRSYYRYELWEWQ